MKPMLRLIRDDPNLDLQLVVTDQHVSAKFGRTIKEVEKEFVVTAAVDMEQQDDLAVSRARALGLCATKMADVLEEHDPHICVLYGDRGEVLATAMAATVLGIPIAHLQGGDLSGSHDEQIRHAVTKLANLHFPSTESSADRIRSMGEEPWRIHQVGDNHVDLIVAGEYAPANEVYKELSLDPEKPVIVVLQHSETTAPQDAYFQMSETLEAVRASNYQAVVVHPCSDPGYEGVLTAIDEIAQPPQFRVRVNLDAFLFWGLLNCAAVLVGNSSAGLIETPYFRLPAVNIGRRQEGRQHAGNMVTVDHERGAIQRALEGAISDPEIKAAARNCEQPFGDGRAGERIVSVLSTIPIDDRLMIKRMTY